VALALVAVAAGCGGGGSSTKAAPRASTTATTATTVVPTSAFSFSGADSARFCEFTRTYYDRFAKLLVGLTGRADKGELRRVVEELTGATREAVAVAPAEIKADMQTVADAATEVVAALDRADFDSSKVPPDVAARLQAPEVKVARDRVDAYVRKVCRGVN
jgi:hypothetical protein